MLRERGSIISDISQGFDFAIISSAFFVTVEIYRFKEEATQDTWIHYMVMFMVYCSLWFIISKMSLVYLSRRFMTLYFEMKQVIKSHVYSFLLTLMVFFVIQPSLIHNRFLVYFETLTVSLVIIAHVAVRLMVQALRRSGRNTRYILLLGSGQAAHAYLEKLNKHPQLGYKAIGYLAPQSNGLDIPYLGDYDQMENVIRSQIVDVTVVTAPLTDEKVKECLDLLDILGKTVTILLDDVVAKVSRSKQVNFDGLPMVAYDSYPRSPIEEFAKRGLDIIGSGLGLVVLSPLLIIIALIIKMTSDGPVLFIQERVGLNGRSFRMLKFRSMVVNAEELKAKLADLNEMSGPVFKITNDPRVTPIGRFIRKTSIDELPQLINVLTGSMSLVGPRPPLPSEVNLYDMKHRKRLAVKPGLTCTWQISGRNNVDFDEWMKMDAEYVEQWSFWLDSKILIKTIPAVLFRNGAK